MKPSINWYITCFVIGWPAGQIAWLKQTGNNTLWAGLVTGLMAMLVFHIIIKIARKA